MKSKILLCTLFLTIHSCPGKKANSYHKVDLDVFTIVLPKNWNQLKVEEFDSSVDAFLTKNNDTVLFDYGKYSSEMDDVINVSHIDQKRKLDSLGFPTDELFFSKNPGIDKNQGTFHKEYYYYEEIDGKIAKIQVPKHIGNGFTKIFFEDIKGKSLSIRGRNLDSIDQLKLLKSFKTLQFK